MIAIRALQILKFFLFFYIILSAEAGERERDKEETLQPDENNNSLLIVSLSHQGVLGECVYFKFRRLDRVRELSESACDPDKGQEKKLTDGPMERLVELKLPAGEYEFYNWASYGHYTGQNIVYSRKWGTKDFSYRFTLLPNKVFYFGNLHLVIYTDKYHVVVRDTGFRDIPRFFKNHPEISPKKFVISNSLINLETEKYIALSKKPSKEDFAILMDSISATELIKQELRDLSPFAKVMMPDRSTEEYNSSVYASDIDSMTRELASELREVSYINNYRATALVKPIKLRNQVGGKINGLRIVIWHARGECMDVIFPVVLLEGGMAQYGRYILPRTNVSEILRCVINIAPSVLGPSDNPTFAFSSKVGVFKHPGYQDSYIQPTEWVSFLETLQDDNFPQSTEQDSQWMTYLAKGRADMEKGDYRSARRWFFKARKEVEKVYTRIDIRWATANDFIAWAYSSMTKYREASKLLKLSLHIRKIVLGPGHLNITATSNFLAKHYRVQGLNENGK